MMDMKLKIYALIKVEHILVLQELMFGEYNIFLKKYFIYYIILYVLVFSVYMCKQWQELKVFNDHTALATGIRFGKHSQFIASTSMDRTLKLYGI